MPDSTGLVKFVNCEKLAKFLIEASGVQGLENVSKPMKDFCNRLMLRIFSQPSLLSFLSDAQIFPSENNDGGAVLELDFHYLPQEVIDPMIRLLAAPRPPEMFEFTKRGSARMGVRIDLQPSDFEEPEEETD